MSWNQPPPQQRYSAVPGFERPDSLASNSRADTPLVGTPVGDSSPDTPEASNSFADLTAHRQFNYNDPVAGGSPSPSQHAALLNDDTSMYSNGRPGRNQYVPMDSPQNYHNGGPDTGYRNSGYQYPVGHGTQGATADDLWAMEGGNNHHQQFTQSTEKVSPRNGGGGGGRSKKWLWIGLAALLVCIGVGVGVGVGVSQANKSSSNAGGSKAASGSGGGSSSTVATGDDPSQFEQDPNLHKVFWGLAYSPKDTIWPNCWANVSTVTKDIQILSQLTSRLRLYGAMCNTTALVLQAIKDTKVDMQVWPAIYIDSNDTAFEVQVEAIGDALKTYGTDNVMGIAVGNEYILNALSAAGAETEPKGSVYTSAVTTLASYITKFRTSLASWNLPGNITVGTGDAGALMSTTLGTHIDYYMANVHPWFAGTTIEDSPQWTWSYFEETDVAPAEASPNKPETFIAETGWPTAYSPPTSEGGDSSSVRPNSDANIANLQYFLDNYVCQANANGTKYFYFEPFDEEWKDIAYGGVEGHWGLFDQNRNLKNITIPTCQ